jgi:plasmid stability protein
MKKTQYTIRNIPDPVDKALRKRAKQTNKSFNKTVVEILSLQTLGTTKPSQNDNFDWLYGAGSKSLGHDFEEAIKEQSKTDARLWQ